MNVENHNLAVRIYDALSKTGANLTWDAVGVIERIISNEECEPVCDFAGCTGKAKFEGWYRPIDLISGEPSGVIRVIKTCDDCKKYLIGAI